MFSKKAASLTTIGGVTGALLIVTLANTHPRIQAHGAAPGPGERLADAPTVLLDVGIHLGPTKTMGAFVLTNEGSDAFVTTPIRTNHNRLIITGPDGRRYESYVWKDGIAPVTVEPSQTRAWQVDLSRLNAFKKPGVYRMYWEIGTLRSVDIVVVRESNSSGSR